MFGMLMFWFVDFLKRKWKLLYKWWLGLVDVMKVVDFLLGGFFFGDRNVRYKICF